MSILIGFLIVVEVIISLLLILIILVQPSKGSGGIGGALGGGMSEQLFGARAGNVLTKGTILFATIFVLNTLALAWLYARQSAGPVLPTPSTASALPIATPETVTLPEVPAEPATSPAEPQPTAPEAVAPESAPADAAPAPAAAAPEAPEGEAP